MGGTNAQDPQGWKRSWGLWGWGLGSRNRRCPGVSPTPGLRGQGTSPGSSASSLGLSGRGSLPPLLWEGPSHLPLLFSPWPPSYAPKNAHDLEGTLGCRGSAWELSRLPGPKWVGQSPSAPLPLLSQGSCHLPLLISLASLLCPQGPTQSGGGLEGRGLAWESQQAPCWPLFLEYFFSLHYFGDSTYIYVKLFEIVS